MTAPKIGYLLPTRERIMGGAPETGPMLALAERAEALGYDSIWIGDSLLARPRHDPLTLMAAVAARTQRVAVGTAVLLPALRNPVVLAHQVATIDRIAEGRVILGYGIANDVPNIRAEFAAAGVPFEKRVGRMLEGLRLCRALWSGEPVDWDGPLDREGRRARADAAQSGRPAGLARRGRARRPRSAPHGISTAGSRQAPTPKAGARDGGRCRPPPSEAGRPAGALTGAVYLTLALDEDAEAGNARIDAYLESYYGAPAVIRRRHTRAPDWMPSPARPKRRRTG